jgi:hypothetical protein
MTRALVVILALLGAACGNGDRSTDGGSDGSEDLSAPAPDDLTVVPMCAAIACVDSCPAIAGGVSLCVVEHSTDATGGCTDGQSTCGVALQGDCGFTQQCLGPNTLGQPFVASPEGGCGIARIHCDNGCSGSDGGTGFARCL